MKQNILITSVGQRVVLTEIFQKSIKEFGLYSKIYSADLNPSMAPAGFISDHCFPICRCTKPEYIEELIALCKKNDIGIIVPTIDTELLVLSQHEMQFRTEGIQVMVSAPDFIKMCRDKRKTMVLFDSLDIHYPRLLDKQAPVFPMFAKPYDGSLSTNLHIIRKPEDLTSDILNDEKLIFTEYIDTTDFKEFTVDMYYGRDNRVKSIVPRERIKIRAGEINKGITRRNAIVNYLKERMDYLPGVIGTICIQLFYREEDRRIYGIEINPRFGGGYPLSYWAHANYPGNIIREYLLGEDIDYSEEWTSNTLMLRYDREVIVYDAQ